MYTLMYNKQNQINQFRRIWNTYKSGKYTKITYGEADNIVLFSNVSPLRKKCFYCDEIIWEIFQKETVEEQLLKRYYILLI